MNNRAVYTSTGNNEWTTPRDFFADLDREFHFTLDAAANDENHLCPKYYTRETDGLKQDWSGERVFCNPPYGQEVAYWVDKVVEEAGKGTLIVLLVKAATETRWFQRCMQHCQEVRFLRRRLKFGGPSKSGATFPSVLFIFNAPESKWFAEVHRRW